jgi:hypothetical protein
MQKNILGLTFFVLAFASYASGQIVTGTEFTASPTDTFTDPPNTMSNYGLTWADYSNGTIGPSAMLSGYGGINLYTEEVRRLTITASGNVGIATTTPSQLLQVGATYSQNPSIMIGSHDNNNSSVGNFSLLFGAFRDVEPTVTSGIVATPTWTCCGGYPASGYAGIRENTLGFYTIYDPANPTTYSPNMLINTNGNVGIGTTTPAYNLDVAGVMRAQSGIVFPGSTTPQTTPWTGVLCGGDYAESVDVADNRTSYEPGDLMVIDPSAPGKFLKSAEAYSTLVAGIYSTKPGAVGRRQTTSKSPDEIPMAMIGIVPTRVSAENGPIKTGDLLVTSSTVGYAMKGTDRERMLGAVIGKALGSLDSGTSVIDVVVTLQ